MLLSIIQVLYEVAFAYGNMNHKFYLYTAVPRSVIHTEMSLREVAALSSILSVECTEEAIDASVFSEKVKFPLAHNFMFMFNLEACRC